MPSIYIILINWNNAPDTIECLNSLIGTYPNLHVILVDNASIDNSVTIIQDWIKNFSKNLSITWILNKENTGFCGGNNVGISLALERQADYILLINNDTLVHPNLLNQLLKTAQTIDNLGILGGKIYCYPQKNEIWFSGGGMDLTKRILYKITEDFVDVRKTEWVVGCLMFIPSNVLHLVKGFDELYYILCEDADLSFRIKTAGFKLLIDGNAILYHKVSKAIGSYESPFAQYYTFRNHCLLAIRHFPITWKILFFLYRALTYPITFLIFCLIGKKDSAFAMSKGYLDFLLKRFGKKITLDAYVKEA